MAKSIVVEIYDTEYEMKFLKSKYINNNNTYVGIIGKDPDEDYYDSWGDLTVNLGATLPPDMACIDVNNCEEGIISKLKDMGLIEDTGLKMPSGFVSYPVYNIAKLLEVSEEMQ